MQNPQWQHLVLLGTASLAIFLGGCTQPNSSEVAESTTHTQTTTMDWEMQWAQAALVRNPTLEILTANREQRAFTVRDRHTAMTAEVQLAQIAAAPLEFLTLPHSSTPSTTPAEAPPKPEPTVPLEPEAVTRLADANEVNAAVVPMVPKASPTYTIDRSEGRTRITGNGISIVYDAPSIYRASTQPELHQQHSTFNDTMRSGSIEVRDESGLATAAARDPHAEAEPVICEGPRVMQLDSRILNVEGDALTARGGCELYITNSTIIASGTGVVIGDATVHINNSRVEGGLASFEAKERAKVFLRGSTLNGLPRRNHDALIQDQGGNSYQ